jgi:hypothetical protein
MLAPDRTSGVARARRSSFRAIVPAELDEPVHRLALQREGAGEVLDLERLIRRGIAQRRDRSSRFRRRAEKPDARELSPGFVDLYERSRRRRKRARCSGSGPAPPGARP